MAVNTSADNRTLARHTDKIEASMRNVADAETVTVSGSAQAFHFGDVFTIPTTSLTDAGSFRRLYLMPPGAFVTALRATPSDADTHATPTLVYDLLFTTAADVTVVTAVSGSTNGQAAAGSDTLLARATGQFVGGTYLALKCTTAAATVAAMTLKLYLAYSIGQHSYAAGLEPSMVDTLI